ncbi:MAG: hypothetical protein JWO63_85 [Frankiales bacterium]|nr:hypothetical protein [Frankiales bacterium]
MAIDWDSLVLGPVMGVFGEGEASDQTSWPLYTPVGGAAFRLADAVFDRFYADVETEGDSEVTTRKPVLGVRLALFDVEPAQNDLVHIPSVGITFVVKDVRPDGHGHAKLILMATAR